MLKHDFVHDARFKNRKENSFLHSL